MGKIASLAKILYHYTTSENAEKIKKSKKIKPSHAGMFLSVNEYGDFDKIYSGNRGNEKWTDGRSDIPNIFLTEIPPEKLLDNPIGVGKILRYAFPTTVKEIMEQGFKVYKNPSAENSNFYNIPVTNKNSLKINPKKCISLDIYSFIPKPNYLD